MTVTTTNHTLWPRHRIEFRAFFLALFGAPLVATLFTFWALVPIPALILGGPLYLAIGTPLLLWWLSRRPCRTGEIALLAVTANVIVGALALMLAQLTGSTRHADAIATYLIFGMVFAPFWGGMFGWLYSTFTTSRSERRYS